jgi:tetratricopeptide (TPR) repeat protein
VQEHPGVPEYHKTLALGYEGLGIVLAAAGRIEEATGTYGKAVAVYKRLVAQNPEPPHYRSGLGSALHNLAMALAAQGNYESAINRYREAISHQRPAFDRHPEIVQFRQFLSNDYFNLAWALRALGRTDEAAGVTRERMRLWPGNPIELYNAACEFALCIPIAERDVARRSYADEAMAALRAAVAAGWSNAAHTARDPDLASLRERPDYRALLAGLFDRAFPADPFAR